MGDTVFLLVKGGTMKEKWFLYTKKADFNAIAEKFHISPIVARIIRNRDVIGDEQIQEYLESDICRLNSPWLFKDMDKAVNLIQIKLSQNNKMRIICDYDVDGICSGYILLKALSDLDANVDLVVPHRIEDGYGINEKMVEKAHQDGVDTIITCDNGIAAYAQIEYAKTLGMTVIITDHHEVPYERTDGKIHYIVPRADAVINQKQSDCSYPFLELCGAMVAYQLVRALYEAKGISERTVQRFLPYAALATVCDVVELRGENRMIVKQGLQCFERLKDTGLCALIEQCDLDKKNITTYHMGFILGPCLNASGRLDSAKKAMELLNCGTAEEAERLAAWLKDLNDERKDFTNKGVEEAIQIAEKYEDPVLVIYLEHCHESIAGIIAGRVRDKYHKPTLILTDAEEGLKGSGRSIEEYDMYEELTKVKSLFTKYGGHKMAAGVSLPRENIEILRNKLNENCNLTQEDLYLKIWIDMQLPFECITTQLIEQLEMIQPFGKGNEKPVFAEKNLKIIRMNICGKNDNVLKMTVQNERGYRITAMMFQRIQEFMAFLSEKFGFDEIDKALQGIHNDISIMVTYYPKINVYHGKTELQIVIDRFC